MSSQNKNSNELTLSDLKDFLISIFPNFFTSLMISISTFTFLIWGKLHGQRLTRKEVIFFDVANLLEINPKFEYESAKLGDECLTPGEVGKEVELPGPQTFWEALFFDERKFQMQKFYKEHYGPVYKTAQRKYAEYLMQVSIRFCGAARPDFKIHFLQQKEERERNGEKSVKKNE